MRPTKKMIRDTKTGFKKRCRELCLMTEEELKSEVKRCFPSETYTGTHGELLNLMLRDLLDLSFPSHWHE